MKESLLKCGYDSIESMGMISVESLTDMEEYLKIKFLPAHKDLILHIVDQIEDMEQRKRPQQSKKQKKTESDKPSRNQRKKAEEVKVKCNKSDSKSTQSLKSKLVEKIKNYVRNNNLGYENMTKDNVIGFKRCRADGKFLYECYFKCPYCEKTHSAKCNLTKNWNAGNIYKHLNEKHKKPESRAAAGVSSTETRGPVIQNVYTMQSTAAPSLDGSD